MGEALRRVVQRSTDTPSSTRNARTPVRAVDRDAPGMSVRSMFAARALQPKLSIGPVDDPFEREAERTADAVMDGPAPSSKTSSPPVASSLMRLVQRVIGKGETEKKKDEDEKHTKVQRLASDPSPGVVPAQTESALTAMRGRGQPLPAPVRAVLEPRFGYDFGAVRTHSGGDAAGAAVALGARAFTVENHIYFGAGEYQPYTSSGQRLLAHELTHTIQQTPHGARTARVQRDFWDDPKGAALAKINEWATALPPYALLTVLLGRNPITDKPVERSPRNILHAALGLVPDGETIFQDLEKNKSIEKAAAWFDAEITKLNLTWEGIKALFQEAWDALGPTDFLSPSKAWEKVKRIFGPTLARVAAFAAAVGAKILEVIRKAVLGKLGAWAKEQRGYLLLTFVLGKDPVTDEAVQRTPKTFVKAVLDLVPGGDKIYENLEKAKTIEKTVAWLDAEITKLDLTWEKIKDLFRKAWDAFSVTDLLNPIALIEKLAGIFLPPAKRVITFAIAVGKKVLEFIFEGAMLIAGPIGLQIVGIVRKIGDTFTKIVDDPVAFVGNLVKAVKLGFDQFAKNIWDHLKTGLIEWLVGGLEGAGLVLPKVWDLRGILDLVLQILGISYAKIRGKLVKVLGEKTVATLEKAFAFVKTLVTEGPVAAWKEIVAAIGGLWDMVIGGIKDWAITKIVTAAITKLVTMFNPAGAIIQAIIATYNTVAFFIERIKQILALVEAIVDSIANIAAGKLAQAANFVERSMARTIPVILGFLARLIGLGDVSTAVKNVITAIQAKVDKGIDVVIAFVVAKAKALFGMGGDDKAGDAGAKGAPPPLPVEGVEPHTLVIKEEGGEYIPKIQSAETQIGAFLDAADKHPKISQKRKDTYLVDARTHLATVKAQLKLLKTADPAGEAKIRADLLVAEKALAAAIKKLLGGVNMEKLREKYLLEGVVKTYATMPKPSYDKLTPDHQPQAALITLIAEVRYGPKPLFDGLGVQKVAKGRAAAGVAINLHEQRHYKSRTYGTPVSGGIAASITKIAGGQADKKQKFADIIAIARNELKEDIKNMNSVAGKPDGPVWAEVDEACKDDEGKVATEEAKALKKDIADRIIAGEKEIAGQNLDKWAE